MSSQPSSSFASPDTAKWGYDTMKVRISRKNKPYDVGCLDLSKACAVRCNPEWEIRSCTGSTAALEVFFPGVAFRAFPEDIYDYQYRGMTATNGRQAILEIVSMWEKE